MAILRILSGSSPGRMPKTTETADDAGLSAHQRKTAIRVANVPEEEFEKQCSHK